MPVGITAFSRFIGDLHEASGTFDCVSLIDWGVGRILDDLGADAHWCGWATIGYSDVIVHSSASGNLPDDYADFWHTICRDDLLARDFRADSEKTATYARTDSRQTEGMIALADRYGLTRMMAAAEHLSRGRPGFFLSAYRGGPAARDWTSEEKEYLFCGVEHLASAARTKLRGALEDAETRQEVVVLADQSGNAFIGAKALAAAFGDVLRPDALNTLPGFLREAASTPGRKVYDELDLIVDVKPLRGRRYSGLSHLTVRRRGPLDCLTAREIEIARQVSDGASHKHIARSLEISPATARNHIQAIYRKTRVDNRVALARLVLDAEMQPAP